MVQRIAVPLFSALALLAAAGCSTAGDDSTPLPVTEVYSVQDILLAASAGHPTPLEATFPPTALATNIREATGSDYWQADGVDVCCDDTGQLIVTASPKMQAMVRTVLEDMRRLWVAAPTKGR